MTRHDFLKLIGAASAVAEYTPVAFLLKGGYAGLGYYNASVNDGFTDTAVFLNARLMDLTRRTERGQPSVRDFNEFLEEVVGDGSDAEDGVLPEKLEFGRPIPLAAVPLHELAVVYPVSQIKTLVRRAQEHGSKEQGAQQQGAQEQGAPIPAFFDLDKSEILKLLRVRLW